MSVTLIDGFYSETGSSTPLYNGFRIATGQSFTNTNKSILDNCVFYLRKNGSPTGNVYAKIYAHSGTFGTSSVPTGLALATSEALDISTLTTSTALKTFTFISTNKIALLDATYYIATVEYDGGDSSNYLAVWQNSTASSHPGNECHYNGSTWVAFSNINIDFQVYGEIVYPIIGIKYPLPPFRSN